MSTQASVQQDENIILGQILGKFILPLHCINFRAADQGVCGLKCANPHVILKATSKTKQNRDRNESHC